MEKSLQQHAAERAEQIRLGLQQTAVLYAKAAAEEDWRVLGYPGITAWAAGEFGPDRFSAERRKEIVAMLTRGGYTVRQVEAATGAGHGTVIRDQQEITRGPFGPPGSSGLNDNDPVASPPLPAPRQRAARSREAAKRSRPPTPPPPVPGTKPKPEPPPQPPQPTAAASPRYHLGPPEIEAIIAADLTRGQIKERFGVGEHAAQLARTAAVATARERGRAVTTEQMLAGELFSARAALATAQQRVTALDREVRALHQQLAVDRDRAATTEQVLAAPLAAELDVQRDLVAARDGEICALRKQLDDRDRALAEAAGETAGLRTATAAAASDLHRLAGEVAELQAAEQAANERLRAEVAQLRVQPAPWPEFLDRLQKEAEIYFEYRHGLPVGSWVGTDRSKVILFLDWLAVREQPARSNLAAKQKERL